MASLFTQIRDSSRAKQQQRHISHITTMFDSPAEVLMKDYRSYAKYGYEGSGPVFSAIQARALALSEVEFCWKTPEGELLPGPSILNTPWQGGTTGQLVTALEVSQSLSGAAYVHKVSRKKLELLRPDWLEVVGGKREGQFVADVLGYIYHPGGKHIGKPHPIPVGNVAAIVPMPNPTAATPVVGQSWISAVAQEVDSDTLMTKHKAKFFTNAATPAIAVVAQKALNPDQREVLREQFQMRHESWENAYKTVFLEGAADIKVIGAELQAINFSSIQGAGETRIASASGVPAVILGFAEGLQAATYSNYQQAMRRFADLTCRPLWRAICDGLHPLVGPPPVKGARLWYKDRDVAFLQQDAKDDAAILKEHASTIQILIGAGFEPETAKTAVINGDFETLKHTGLVSVQLNPAGEEIAPEPEPDDTEEEEETEE